MMVREGRAAIRKTAQKPKEFQSYSFPAPSLGWVANNNLSVSQPGGAFLMENFFPTATGAVMRRGKQKYATLGTGSLPVRSIFSYVEGTSRKLFASNDEAIWDISTVAEPNNNVLGTEAAESLVTENADYIGWGSTKGFDVFPNTYGRWIVAQFQTSGGTFLRGVNGVDTPFVYDGAGFDVEPALTFPEEEETTPERLSYVWSYKNRLWFIEKDSMNVWYLPVDQIGGALVKLPLGGEFTLGGQLVFGATWSQDVGDGLNAMIAFFSSEGEVAVYQGSNPASLADWAQVGVYRTGKAMGDRAHVQIGGDLLIATDVGMVPLSEALRRDYSALAGASISNPIEAAWPEEVALRSAEPWNCVVWTAKQIMAVALPTTAEQPPRMLIMNSRTGKWTRYSDWGSTCVHVYQDRMFFGDETGGIYEAEVGGLDNGRPFTATIVPTFDQFGVPGLKTVTMARAVLKCAHAVQEKITIQSDYEVKLPPAPAASAATSGSFWGTATWGVSTWGGTLVKKVIQKWRSVFGAGEVHSAAIQITSGSIIPMDVEIIRTDVLFTVGDVIS